MNIPNKKYVSVNDLKMAYVETGNEQGDPIVFLHGNPTSSYLWRNIMPHAERFGRCIAPDLIGMGDSDKLPESGPDRYKFLEHQEYLDGFLRELGIDNNVVLVIHDWGSALGFDWARRNPNSVKGIAYMEAMVTPKLSEDMPDQVRGIFEGFRSPEGERICLEENFFVENLLPFQVIREMDEETMSEYRRPFQVPGEDRRPTLTWPREIPIDGQPAAMHDLMETYSNWMAATTFPKLFVNADPGAQIVDRHRDICRTWQNQTEITVPGRHFLQEDSSDEIGKALTDWLSNI